MTAPAESMTTPLTVRKTAPPHPAMDYGWLRQEGLRQLARLAGQTWTDHNSHDPGITILEQLCYALTDLGYRIHHDLEDLLAGGLADEWFTASRMLTCDPVTEADLRRLVIDVEGVKNAWVTPAAVSVLHDPGRQRLSLAPLSDLSEPVSLKGLYDVGIVVPEHRVKDGTEVVREVTRRLHAHRGLGTDFHTVAVLENQPVQVITDIEIDDVTDLEELLSQVYTILSEAVSPSVRFHSARELLEEGRLVEDIFDGPPLEHGYITNESLHRARRRSALRSSDVIGALTEIPGVNAVRRLKLKSNRVEHDWSLALDEDKVPWFDLERSQVQLHHGSMRVEPDLADARDRHTRRLASWKTLDARRGDPVNLEPPKGRNRKVDRFESILHLFPTTYGVGPAGLPATATAGRRAMARQLRAYLSLFDQLLANDLAQLAHVGELFSYQSDDATTYFSQTIEDPELPLDELRMEDDDPFEKWLQRITEDPDADPQTPPLHASRMNRFLDHLLARHGESFGGYGLALQERHSEGGARERELRLIEAKRAFLRDYPRLSSARGTGVNLLLPPGPDNVSGIETRLRRLLDLDADDTMFVVEHILLRPVPGDEGQRAPLLRDAIGKDPYSLQLTFVMPRWRKRFAIEADRDFAEATILRETPVYLTPRVIWIETRGEMNEFGDAYQAWLDEVRRQSTAGSAAGTNR